MLPKSKRAKRRNRHFLSNPNGYILYIMFRCYENDKNVTNVVGADAKYRVFAFFKPVNVRMVGGTVTHG